MNSINEYIEGILPERRDSFLRLYQAIKSHLPKGFEETMQYGMITWVVPKSLYPAGYHAKPTDALPFISLASQKNFIAVYHMGLYSHEQLLHWFQKEYAARCKTKLDMGKSCIRLKKMEDIPMDLFGELAAKMNPEEWIKAYERALRG